MSKTVIDIQGLHVERDAVILERLSHCAGAPSLVLVTHHVEEIMPGFSHALILKGGRVLASGAKHQVMSL